MGLVFWHALTSPQTKLAIGSRDTGKANWKHLTRKPSQIWVPLRESGSFPKTPRSFPTHKQENTRRGNLWKPLGSAWLSSTKSRQILPSCHSTGPNRGVSRQNSLRARANAFSRSQLRKSSGSQLPQLGMNCGQTGGGVMSTSHSPNHLSGPATRS